MQERYEKLREELAGFRQVVELDRAVMAAILEKTGEVTLEQADIRRHLQEVRQIRADYSTTDGSYRLWLEGGEGA